MTRRDVFLKRLTENEDDTRTRLAFADWLDEEGEHEEADRQRKWPAAKKWLGDMADDTVSYAELIDFGRRVVEGLRKADRVYFQGGAMSYTESLWDDLNSSKQAFWWYWSIVTGIRLPPELDKTLGFHYWECCPHDVSFWFGSPDQNDAEDSEE